MNPKIAQVVVGLPVDGPFDYSIGRNLRNHIAIGQRVRVSFNRRNRVGFVVGLRRKSAFKSLNPVLSLLDSLPVLDANAFKLTKLFSKYYGCSWGEAIETCLPNTLRKERVSEIPLEEMGQALTPGKGEVSLVHDIGGEKRWPYLVGQIEDSLKNNQSVIFLVPEISLIKEIETKSRETFACPIAILDKKLTPKKELEQWIQIRSGKAHIIIGTRSAVFAPASHLGLVIINDEEHSAYKQEQTPYYHVHEVALMRSKIDHCRVLFVSSTPSAEIWEMAKKNRFKKVTLADGKLADMQIVDMTNYNPRKTSILSFPLQSKIQKTLEQKGKVVLFMNRRGFGTSTRCNQCGFKLKCERCNVNLTYLFSKKQMVCRLCNFKMDLPKVCPNCRGTYLRSVGTGIEKLESEAARLYPQAQVSRYDRESTALPKKADIIIGTQAIFKMIRSLSVELIAVLNFDAELHHFDFRSAHKAFSLLIHLRQFAAEKVLVQTHMTEDYTLTAAQKTDFNYFYQCELKHRRELGFPPFRHLVSIGLRGTEEENVFEQSKILFALLEKNESKDVELSDPHPDINPKLRDKYRYTILLKGKSVRNMLSLAKTVLKDFRRRKNVVVTINVDP